MKAMEIQIIAFASHHSHIRLCIISHQHLQRYYDIGVSYCLDKHLCVLSVLRALIKQRLLSSSARLLEDMNVAVDADGIGTLIINFWSACVVDRPKARAPMRTGEKVLRVNPIAGPIAPALALASLPLGEETLTLLISRAIECGLMDVLVTAVVLLTDPSDWWLLLLLLLLLLPWTITLLPGTPGSANDVGMPEPV